MPRRYTAAKPGGPQVAALQQNTVRKKERGIAASLFSMNGKPRQAPDVMYARAREFVKMWKKIGVQIVWVRS